MLRGSIRDGGCEVVQLHGDLVSLRCLSNCAATCAWQEIHNKEFLRGQAPECSSCAETNSDRLRRGKRTTKIGSLRPNVVLYGEQNPSESELSSIIQHDLRLAPDLVLILGTSLKVHGLKVLVKEFAKAVHEKKKPGKVVFVNNTAPSPSTWDGVIDYWLQADCDQWALDLKQRVPDLFKKQQELSPKYLTSLGSARSPKVPASLKKVVMAQGTVENKFSSTFQRESSPSAQRAQRLSNSPAKRKPLASLAVATNAPVHSSESGKSLKTPLKEGLLPTPPTSKRSHIPKALSPSKRQAFMIAPATLDETPPPSPLNLRHIKQGQEGLIKEMAFLPIDRVSHHEFSVSISKKRGAHWMRPSDPRDLHQLYPSKRRKIQDDIPVFEDSDAEEDAFQVQGVAKRSSDRSHTPSPIKVVIERQQPSSQYSPKNPICEASQPLTISSTTNSTEEIPFVVPETPKHTSKYFPKLPTPESTAKRSRDSPRKKKSITVLNKQEGQDNTRLVKGKFEWFWRKRPREGPMQFEFDAKGAPKWITSIP